MERRIYYEVNLTGNKRCNKSETFAKLTYFHLILDNFIQKIFQLQF
jgi:hypothetical protein